MKFQGKYVVSALLALTLLAGWITPAYAATVVSASPSSIVNDVPRTITVIGTGFDNTALILLDGSSLTTVFVDAQTLTATVPAGVTPGTHVITVTMGAVVLSPSLNLDITASVVVPPTATPSPPAFGRPQLVISSYSADNFARTGKDFNVEIGFNNAGTYKAVNAQVAFSSADVSPTDTGGVLALGSIPAGGHVDTAQNFFAANSLAGKSAVLIDAILTYYDEKGNLYTDKFTLTIAAVGTVSETYYPTATPTGVNTAQLVITSYASTIDPLQPGEQFQLGVTVQNMGNSIAKSVTMIVGGGGSGTSGGTPQPGGVSGGSGEFTNFAPVGSSNIQSLGDIPAGGGLQVLQNLVVNVSTNPGAYPMKITFSYVNSKGEVVNDDQVITLLVYSLPNVDVSFYSPPQPFFAGQPGALPLQIVNLGKRSTVLGNMKIEAKGGMVDPATTLVGSLDPGGYFTFDSTLTPDLSGPLELSITIDYTDDFNKSRTITKTLNVTVEEAFVEPTFDPSLEGMDGMQGTESSIVSDESFLQKTWRFVLGVLGLDSALPAEVPQVDPSLEEMPVPLPSGGGGKG
jgi:hypothetical protein